MSARPHSRERAERRGRNAERLAALCLVLKGWRILARRARTAAGEIDLIARRGAVLAFIEVKARASDRIAAEAVTPRQAARLVRAAALWRARQTGLAALQPRFDVVLVVPGRWPRHLKGAFSAEGADAMRLA
ncbi:YraN family protein [Marinicauda sp. Alg238-R41]|uniref:YraN family protein n=1 Tax=Marinicauda sp. Alg238-R41 TaxID=2993447 RepID=UPI0022DEF24E|nr:YraN family protein [Marinicauda sp. Alg238-R41]